MIYYELFISQYLTRLLSKIT